MGAVQRIREQAQGLRIGHVTLDLRQIDFASRQLLAERIHVRFAQCQADAHGGRRQKNRHRRCAAETAEGQYDQRGDRPAEPVDKNVHEELELLAHGRGKGKVEQLESCPVDRISEDIVTAERERRGRQRRGQEHADRGQQQPSRKKDDRRPYSQPAYNEAGHCQLERNAKDVGPEIETAPELVDQVLFVLSQVPIRTVQGVVDLPFRYLRSDQGQADQQDEQHQEPVAQRGGHRLSPLERG